MARDTTERGNGHAGQSPVPVGRLEATERAERHAGAKFHADVRESERAATMAPEPPERSSAREQFRPIEMENR